MSNNTQVVSVPRELLKHALDSVEYLALRGDDIGTSTVPVADALRLLLAAPAEDVRAVVDTPVLPELTSDLREILGRPNFTCHFIAKALRLMDFDIPQKSEEEQAVTIYWMLGHYLRDPVNWRDAASAELKAGAAAQPAQQ